MNPAVEKILQNSRIELCLRWILGSVFVYASYHKIVDPAQFAKVIYGYYLFPEITINLIAIVLPFVELFAGVALLLGIYPRSAGLLLQVLLLFFIAAISINLFRGVEFDCGCFSFGERGYATSARSLLARDLALFIANFQVILFGGERRASLL